MRAIVTSIIGQTNCRPTRVKAQLSDCRDLTLVASYDSLQDGTLQDNQVHGKLAIRLAEKLGWLTPANYLIGGAIRGGCYVWVFSDSPYIPAKETEAS